MSYFRSPDLTFFLKPTNKSTPKNSDKIMPNNTDNNNLLLIEVQHTLTMEYFDPDLITDLNVIQ